MSRKALERYLEPIAPILATAGVTEICVNRPHEVFVERNGKFEFMTIPELELDFLKTLVALIAESNGQTLLSPLVAGSLPCRARVQCVLSPACESDRVILSIRRHQMQNLSLSDYEASDAFITITDKKVIHQNDDQLCQLYKSGGLEEFITGAIHAKKNILISGGTGTGKTTFLNACLKKVPEHERLITIEDTREVKTENANSVALLFNEDDAQLTAAKLFKACLRLRPDRILLSELRGGDEVRSYLRAANSGHPGSLSTVHADTPEAAFMQLVMMMQQAESTSSEEKILNYVKSIIPIVVQLKRDEYGKRDVSTVYFSAMHGGWDD